MEDIEDRIEKKLREIDQMMVVEVPNQKQEETKEQKDEVIVMEAPTGSKREK